MPPRRKAQGLTQEQLVYLAGLWDGTIGLRGTSETFAVAVSIGPEWPQYMAKTYGGEHKPHTAKNRKIWQGWFVPLERRHELFTMLEDAGLIRSLEPINRDGVRHKLERAVNNKKG